MATVKELTEMSAADLTRRATELRDTLFRDQLKLRTGALDNPSERTNHKRDLARVLTVLNQKSATPPAAASKPAPKAAQKTAAPKKAKTATKEASR